MRIQSLKHTAEAVLKLSGRDRVIVLGSSSLLATYPALGEPGQMLEPSIDADLLLEPCDEQLAMLLDEAVGQDRKFHEIFGYHADILRPAITELLPRGWRERLVPLPDCPGVVCLEPHDLAVAKLQAGRPKDLALLASLLAAKMLDEATIRLRIDYTRLDEKMVLIIFRKLQEALEIAKNQTIVS